MKKNSWDWHFPLIMRIRNDSMWPVTLPKIISLKEKKEKCTITSMKTKISELSSYWDISSLRAEISLYFIPFFPPFLEQWFIVRFQSVYIKWVKESSSFFFKRILNRFLITHDNGWYTSFNPIYNFIWYHNSIQIRYIGYANNHINNQINSLTSLGWVIF